MLKFKFLLLLLMAFLVINMVRSESETEVEKEAGKDAEKEAESETETEAEIEAKTEEEKEAKTEAEIETTEAEKEAVTEAKTEATTDSQIGGYPAFCRDKEGATDKDMQDWSNNVTPKSKIVKCVDACIAEKTGRIVDNKFNVADMEAIIDQFYDVENYPEDNAIQKEIVNECKSITDEDRCEMVAKILDCLKEGAKKHGVEELI